MKKILILLSILLLTGCSAEYDLVIDKNSFKEDVKISEVSKSNWTKLAYDTYNYKEAIDFFTSNKIAVSYRNVKFEDAIKNSESYEASKITNNQELGVEYSYDFKSQDFSTSTMVKACYDLFNILIDGDSTYLSTSKEVNCFERFPLLDKITINVQSRYIVTGNNADVIDTKTNTYTWNLTKNEAQNSPIYLVLDNSKKFDGRAFWIKFFADNPLWATIISISIIGAIILGIVLILNKKNNRI